MVTAAKDDFRMIAFSEWLYSQCIVRLDCKVLIRTYYANKCLSDQMTQTSSCLFKEVFTNPSPQRMPFPVQVLL